MASRQSSTAWISCRAMMRLPAAARAGAENGGAAHASIPRRAARAVFASAFAVLAVLFVFAVPTGAQAQSCVGTTGPCFQGLGFLSANPKGESPASFGYGISPDGSTVVGYSNDTNGYHQSFSWSNGTMTGLGFFYPSCSAPNGPDVCGNEAYAVNGLGVIVGESASDAAYGGDAFSYSGGTMTGLGYLSTTCARCPTSLAQAIASQANVPVGWSFNSNNFTEAVSLAGPTGLGFLSTAITVPNSVAYGVNSNGQVIVGQSTNAAGSGQAFSWQGGTMTGLPYLHSTDNYSAADAVSASGSIVVGYSGTEEPIQLEAVRWVNGTVTDLGAPGYAAPFEAVSANGNVVVTGDNRWTPVDGVNFINNLLSNAGVNVSGWGDLSATAVSANGTTIAGYSIDPNGHTQAWIARLPAPGGPLVDSHDFNGDGKSDIAWRDSSGDNAMWLMNGSSILSSAGLGTISTAWSIVGQRDFNGDGMADWLWHDTSGDLAIWFMNGTTVTSGVGLGTVTPVWSIVGTGDFNGDGKGDILWRDTSGDIAMWLMNGSSILSSAGLGSLSTAWSVVGTGDFDGNGTTDILWRDSSGDIAIWFMNGTTVSSGVGLGTIAPPWTIVGTGDFNGDGKADILWRNTSTGAIAVWLMNGSSILSSAGLGSIATTWSIVETGDFNGDGMSDILWHDTSGDVAIWFMNGTTVSSGVGLGTIPTSWTIQGVGAD